MEHLIKIKELGDRVRTTREDILLAMKTAVFNMCSEISQFGHTYITTDEDRDKCEVVRFIIVDGILQVELEYEDTCISRHAPASILNVEELVIIMEQMTEDVLSASVQIDTLFLKYLEEYNEEPKYAECKIAFIDDMESTQDVTIKLSSDVVEHEDDSIFFYCDSPADFKSLMKPSCQDFVIVECLSFD